MALTITTQDRPAPASPVPATTASPAAPVGARPAPSPRTGSTARRTSFPAAGSRPVDPSDRLLAIAEELVGRGVALADVVGQLVTTSGRDRGIVKEAYLRQVQRMHRLASDDFHATKVLTALERTLARLPYRLEDDQQRHDAERRGRWWWSRRAQ